MWIYKHDLFHRDRPQDLVLLRRRHGPANVDGRRRQQDDSLPIPSVHGANCRDNSTDAPEADDEACHKNVAAKKRASSLTYTELSGHAHTKRPVLLWNTPSSLDISSMGTLNQVDTSIQPVPLTESEDSDDQDSSSSVVNDQIHGADHSTTVAEVAWQLEQFARKALGRSEYNKRLRRQGAATPPCSLLDFSTFSSGSLLTYDDECIEPEETDGEDCLVEEPIRSLVVPPNPQVVSNHGSYDLVCSASLASQIVQGILSNFSIKDRDSVATTAKVVEFCLSTPARQDENGRNLEGKINELLLSCEELALDFHQYKEALFPLAERFRLVPFGAEIAKHECGDDIRAFRTFAMNKMQRLVRYCTVERSESDGLSALEQAMTEWQSW
jgi:hypothetical protein